MFTKYDKFLTALIGAALTVLNTFGLSNNHYVTLALTVLTALGVYAVPNKSTKA